MKTGSGEAHGLRSAIALLIGGAALVFGLYFLQFHGALSENRDDWAAFGSYASGAFSFLTLCGVAFTIKLQADQLRLIQSQSHLEELQRMAASTSTSIDALLNLEQPTVEMPDAIGRPPTVASILGVYTVYERVTDKDERAFLQGFFEADARDALDTPSYVLTEELDQLGECLSCFEDSGGNPQIAAIYRRRYRDVVAVLRDHFKLEAEGPAARFFIRKSDPIPAAPPKTVS